MKKIFLCLFAITIIYNSNAQTKIIDAVNALNGKAIKGTLTDTKTVNFFLEYDDNSKTVYAKTRGKSYSNLNQRIVFINDYIATYGWVSFEEENGIIEYQTILMVADGNRILIGRPMGIKSKSADNPYEFTYEDKISIDDIYAEEKIEIADRKTIAANCRKQILAAMQEIVNKTKLELEKLKSNNSLVLSGKLKQISNGFKSMYYGIQPKADVIAKIKGQNTSANNDKQTTWENAFAQKIKSGEFKSIADFANEISKPNAAYEYVTMTPKYDRETEKFSFIIGEKVLTRLKEAKITYDPNGGKFVKQIELIPVADNHPKTPNGEVTLHYTGSIDGYDENYLTNGYLLNKKAYATERGFYYKGYYIVKQQGDVDPDPKKFMEFLYNYYAIRPVGLAPISIDRNELDRVGGQYRIKEQILTGEKLKF